MTFVKKPLNATTPREIIEYSQDLEDRTEEAFDDVDSLTTSLSGDVNTLNNFKNEVADYVVEQGANYTKWNSGKAEAWGRGTITPSSSDSTTVGGQKWYRNSMTTTLPINFVDVGTVSAAAISSVPWGVIVNAVFDITNANTVTVWLARYNTTATGVSWYLLGTWK